MLSRHLWLSAALCVFLAAAVNAQGTGSRLDSLDFSGVFFANYQYHADTGLTRASNRFDVERIYLTFRMPVGENLGVRVTTDIFQTQSSDGTVRGWLVRAKYAYLQYDFGDKKGFNGLARFGIVPTVIIDHEESFWPRYIAPVAVDRGGLVPPADAGIATVLVFPRALGEAYASITNGPGYTARESDRFKDFAARVSITPLSARAGWLKSLTITGWAYRGAIGSRFASGGPGQIGPIGAGMPRNRWGVFTGVRDPRLTMGAHFGTMSDASESGANTVASPRAERDSSGRFLSAFMAMKPFQLASRQSKRPLGFVLRLDDFTTNRNAGTGYRLWIAGLTSDLSKRARISLDYQLLSPKRGPTLALTRTYFLHLVANF